MSTKKVDNRVRYVIENAVRHKHRAFVLLVGDEGKTQVVNLHYMLSKARNESKISVLWCMKNELAFGGMSKKKRSAQSRKEVGSGKVSQESHESFETFLSHTSIRYNYYKESHKILGNTFDMLILQDFEALQPNVLARTVETVAGGGLVVLMLRTMTSLKQLYTMSMDVHTRYRSEQHQSIVPRFNERFLLSFADCSNFLCVDDSLNVLPITHRLATMTAPVKKETIEGVGSVLTVAERDLLDLKEKLANNPTVGALVKLSSTLDQAKAIMSLVAVITEKTLRATVAITAGRGRGKSAALGIAVAGAVSQGYSNILVTAPSPENLVTFFEFLVKTLKELGYTERTDFEIMQSALPEMKHCTIRVNIFKKHRQTVQYVFPQDSQNFAQAELVVIDEAAAIPLTMVQKMIGPYLIFISSTISGYEGTGRSLSLKLLAELKAKSSCDGGGGTRSFKEIELKQPIRYASGDPVEAWLHTVLCLEATSESYTPKSTPHPSQCTLHYVDRDALFSYHATAEQMLQRMMSLLVSAHYKNQPNDLQLLSDAPAHHIYALLGPIPSDSTVLPDVYCVVQVCEEGSVSAAKVAENLGSAMKPSGDIIPYTLAQQFQQPTLAALSGVRIVRIATHPKMQKCGYGSRALEELVAHYRGGSEGPVVVEETTTAEEEADGGEGGLAPRHKIPVLLQSLSSRRVTAVDYMGTVFGVTTPLFQFWSKAGFNALYLRQQANETTAEHSVMMALPFTDSNLLGDSLRGEFHRRFLSLLPLTFRGMPLDLSLSIALDVPTHNPLLFEKHVSVDEATGLTQVDGVSQATAVDITTRFTPADLSRLRAYSQLRVDLGVVLDLVPALANLYFSKRLFRQPLGGDGITLSPSQAIVLLGVGLHGFSFDELGRAPVFAGVPNTQLRAFFTKGVQVLTEYLLKVTALAEEEPIVGDKSERVENDGEGRPKRMEISRVHDAAAMGPKRRKK